jgi:hypothetical protein
VSTSDGESDAGGAVIGSVTDVKGGVQIAITFTCEVEGATKPAWVAGMLLRALA